LTAGFGVTAGGRDARGVAARGHAVLERRMRRAAPEPEAREPPRIRSNAHVVAFRLHAGGFGR
jgi:hypothetical protein